MDAGEKLKKILDLIPLNGSKTSLSLILTVLGFVQSLVPGADIIQLLVYLLSNGMTGTGIVGLLIALLHRQLKKKYPDAEIINGQLYIKGRPVLNPIPVKK